jgi:hypothetical protein
MATASVAYVTPDHDFHGMFPERIEALLRARRVRLGLTRFKLCEELDISWNKMCWMDSGKEPPDDLTMAQCFEIARTVYAIPNLNDCAGVAWDESTRYEEIRRAGGWMELQFVNPMLVPQCPDEC